MLMGLGLFTLAGVTGAVLFLVHHMPVKTILFLVGGLIEDREGTSALDRDRRPRHAGPAGSRCLLRDPGPEPRRSSRRSRASSPSSRSSTPASMAGRRCIPIVVVALANSVLTLLSMVKIWIRGVLGRRADPELPQADAPVERGGHRLMVDCGRRGRRSVRW